MNKYFRYLSVADSYLAWRYRFTGLGDNDFSGQQLSGLETLMKLDNERLSFARFGEGEFRLAFCQGDTIYETCSRSQSRILRSILLNDDAKHTLLGLNILFSKSHEISWVTEYMRTTKEVAGFRSVKKLNDVSILSRIELTDEYRRFLKVMGRYSKASILGEASCFSLGTYVREYSEGRLDEIRSLVFSIFQANRTLLISPSTPQSGGNLLERFATKKWDLGDITHYEIPQTQAFSKYHEILNYVERNSNLFDLVVVQGGATASILAFEIPRRFRIRTLDVGGLAV
jgi:hypothetical protein